MPFSGTLVSDLYAEYPFAPKKKEPSKSVASKKNNKKYTVQVASLKDAESADNMVSDLKKKGYSAYKSLTKVPEKGIWHRVRIGYFNNHKEAAAVLGKLKKDNMSAIVVLR